MFPFCADSSLIFLKLAMRFVTTSRGHRAMTAKQRRALDLLAGSPEGLTGDVHKARGHSPQTLHALEVPTGYAGQPPRGGDGLRSHGKT